MAPLRIGSVTAGRLGLGGLETLGPSPSPQTSRRRRRRTPSGAAELARLEVFCRALCISIQMCGADVVCGDGMN